jgi:putative peptidoglycan lipid II flippase
MRFLSAIRSRFHNAHSDNHAIARGMAWVILFVFLGKLAGAAKEMAIAYRYGISEELDAYLFIFNLVSWPVGVWFSVLTVVLVPLAARIRHNISEDLPCFRAELLGLTILLGIGLMIFAWLGLPVLLRSSWTGLPPTSATIGANMVSGLVVLAPLGVLISLFSAWMLSAGRQANTLLESVPAIVLLVAILAFPADSVEPLVWGTVVGFAFHLITLAVPLAWRGEIEEPCFTRQSPQWPAFWQGFGIMLAGQTLMSFIGIIDQFFAAHLGAGAIATLSYANRILALLLGLGATAVTRATLPIFSRAQAADECQLHLYRVAAHWVRLLFVFGVIAMIAGWWLVPWAVKLLFERGAFMARDTEYVTEVLRYGLAQLPFYFSGLVLVSLLASKRKYKLIAISAGVNLLVKVVASFILIPLMGINGVMTATAVMYFFSLALLYWFVNDLAKQRDVL